MGSGFALLTPNQTASPSAVAQSPLQADAHEQVRLQPLAGAYVPYQVFLMLPFVLSIIALIVMSRRAEYPRALMVPYRKGER